MSGGTNLEGLQLDFGMISLLKARRDWKYCDMYRVLGSDGDEVAGG